jgi:Cys-tRNA(Pro)/Cys-tRNA(Cys) deacylase
MKTNGARFLESLGIPFELREYEVDPDDLSATTVAKKIGMPAEQVFKTLLTTDGAHGYVFAVIPGDAALDFKKLSRLAGWRKAEMAPLKDVQPLTGYIRGGVTVFGAKKPYPIYVDETAILFDRISVSAGTRGTQLILAPDDYLRAAAAIGQPVQTADLTKDAGAAPSNQNFAAPFSNQNAGAPSLASRLHGETTRVGDHSSLLNNPHREGSE